MWPGIAVPSLTARTSGACYLVGGVLVAMVTTVAPDRFSDTSMQYLNAAVAAVVGVCVLLIGQRLTPWQFHLLVVIAILQITVAVTASAGAVAVSFATLYAFVACAAFFVAWPTAVVFLGLAIASCMAALSLAPGVPWWTGVVTAATTAVIGTIIAILGRIVAEAELDDVTGLPNRRGFDRLIGAEINRAHPAVPGPAVVLICVDGYAAVQEEFGDRAADALLGQVVESWRGLLARGQVLARRGEEELVFLLPATGEQDALIFVQRLRSEYPREFSAGVSVWNPGESTSPMLERAEVALRRARAIGRNRTMLESSDLPPLALQLSDALDAEAVGVRYQPVVRLTDDAVVGVEALLQWSPAFGSDLQAGEVIRVAEDNQLIALLDQYVLRRACLDAQWIQDQSPQLRLVLGVNVSGLELVEDGYVARVVGTLDSTGWPPEQLVLEVTESVLDVDRPASVNALRQLRARGIRIAIDDFGTGYSSLSRLHKLPTDLLKLDGSFTSSISPASTSAPPLLQAVAGLADALGLPIVVEGVETSHQASVLRGMGFPMAQGYHFGRPQTREDVVTAIAQAPR